jgi:hypothetical protein
MKSTFENVCRRAHNNESSYCEFKVKNPNELLYFFAVGAWGNGHYATPGIRGFGENDRPETIEMWIKTNDRLETIRNWNFVIDNYNDCEPGDTEVTEDGNTVYCYHLCYVPKSYIGDVFPELYPLVKDVNKEDEESEKYNFSSMYMDFERKFNPYPVQMSRRDAFYRAYNEGLITEEILNKARDYYGSLWNYVGD